MSTTPSSRSTPLAFKLVLALFATVVGFGLCEIGARILYTAPPDPTREPQIAYRFDPEIRYVLEPNQKGWVDDGLVTVNAQGFRGRETVIPKPAGRLRIVIIGDSVTMGWGVADNEAYAAQLEDTLHKMAPGRDLDVVNLGVGGYNTRQAVSYLRRNVERLDPDLVLLGFYSNDVPDGLDDKDAMAPSGTRIAVDNPQPGQVLHMNPVPTSWWEKTLRRSRVVYKFGGTIKRLLHKGEWGSSRFQMELDVLQGKQSPEIDSAWAIVERHLGELKTLADGRFRVGIIVLPCREQVTGEFSKAQYQTRLRAIADRLGFFAIDPLPGLVARKDDVASLFIPYDRNHPSAIGHAIIAKAIADDLIERGALNAQSAGH